LRDFTLAESHLSCGTGSDAVAVSLIERLVLASKLYLQGLSSLKAATSPTRVLQFQGEFGRLRIEFMSACSQLVQACRTLQTAPPSAIAHAVAAAHPRRTAALLSKKRCVEKGKHDHALKIF
jgi:integrator complex subunit 7